MSDRNDIDADRAAHGERWDADLAAYSLDALEPDEKRAVEEHLAGCAACAERLRWMQPAVDVLPATAPPQTPPPELKARIMEVVERESAAAEPTATALSGGERRGSDAAPPRRFRWFGGLRPRTVLAGVGVVLLLAAAVTGYALRDGGTDTMGQPVEVFAAVAEGGSGASGRLEVDGDAGTLHVAKLPPIGEDEVYQAWIQDSVSAGGSVHPSSVFVVSGDGEGDVAIPHGLADARRVMVTREPKGGSEHPSEGSLLTAELG